MMRTMDAIASDAAVVTIPSAVSLWAIEARLINARPALTTEGTAVLLDDLGQAEHLRAQMEAGALRRVEVDGEAQRPAFHEEAGDAAALGEALEVTDGEHRLAGHAVEKRGRP